jgi:hypothetical protein
MSTIKDFVSVTELFAGCPSCRESFALRDANLFDATKRLPIFAIEHFQREHTKVAGELKGDSRAKGGTQTSLLNERRDCLSVSRM